jgi:hypothetical protein
MLTASDGVLRCETRTGKVDEVEIGDVWTTDMDNDAIRRKWNLVAGICSREKGVWWL